MTPSGPTTQQQTGPQHHLGVTSEPGGVLGWELGGGCWSELCLAPWLRAWLRLKEKGIKYLPLGAPWKAAQQSSPHSCKNVEQPTCVTTGSGDGAGFGMMQVLFPCLHISIPNVPPRSLPQPHRVPALSPLRAARLQLWPWLAWKSSSREMCCFLSLFSCDVAVGKLKEKAALGTQQASLQLPPRLCCSRCRDAGDCPCSSTRRHPHLPLLPASACLRGMENSLFDQKYPGRGLGTATPCLPQPPCPLCPIPLRSCLTPQPPPLPRRTYPSPSYFIPAWKYVPSNLILDPGEGRGALMSLPAVCAVPGGLRNG